MTYDEFKLHGREQFAEFRYYKGEDENPYSPGSAEFRWWDFEKDYLDNYSKSGEWKSFSEYFDFWIKEKAAPEIGHDLKKSNPWKSEYEENAPF